jgi:hypothetical protein
MKSALLVDTTSIYDFQQYLKHNHYRVYANIDYGALLDSVSHNYEKAMNLPTSQEDEEIFNPMLAFVAIDPEHEGQRKFTKFLEETLGFTVDETDYRHAYVVPNRESHYRRLSTQLTYSMGLLAAKKQDLVVVTDAFDTYFPLLNYAERGGNVTIAFFKRGMEDRWARTGLFENNSPIRFLDLSVDSGSIVGADLSYGKTTRKGANSIS